MILILAISNTFYILCVAFLNKFDKEEYIVYEGPDFIEVIYVIYLQSIGDFKDEAMRSFFDYPGF